MSGHSKWSKVKHQKGVADVKRSQTFTKLGNAISIAVAKGSGIATVIEKARAANMPKANIDRAIERGLGRGGDTQVEEITYEGFAPGRVAILVSAATDNRQRTRASLKNIFNEFGGLLTGPGSAAYMFEYCGEIKVKKGTLTDDQLMELALDVGSIDIKIVGEAAIFYTDSVLLHQIKKNLSKRGLEIIDAQLAFRPTTTLKIEDKQTVEKILNLVTRLEEDDDVQKVSVNLRI